MRNQNLAKLQWAWAPVAVFTVAFLLISCGGGGGGGGGGSSSSTVTGGSSGATTGTSTTGSSTTGSSTTGTTGSPDGPLGCPLDTYAPNYCEETDPGSGDPNTVHWWDHFALKVYFTSDPTIQGQQLSTVCMTGFNAWAAVAGKNVAVQVGTQGEADVVVSFENLATPPGGGQWVGQAGWSYNPSTFKAISATVTLRTWNGMSLAQVADGLRRTAQHEFGHVTFMGGHSEAAADTMYPSGTISSYTALTTRDLNSLNTAYCGSFGDRAPSRSTGPLVQASIDCPRP